MRDERGPWYLLTGLVIGAVLGLAYAWVISPREYQDNSPASLRSDFKDQYRALIAAAYVATGNLPRAEARLAKLGDADIARALAEQAQRALAEGSSPREAQALGILAVALGQAATPSVLAPSLTSPLNSSTSTPIPSINPAERPTETPPVLETSPSPSALPKTAPPLVSHTVPATGLPLPTRTPTPIQTSPFALEEKTFVCNQDIPDPLIQIFTESSDGSGLPGIEAVVSWEGKEEHFFTGLKPELGSGYADFLMAPGVTYSLRLAAGSEVISDLIAGECETQSGRRYWGSWVLIFSRP